MYPYDNAFQWWLKGRYAHLVAAMERHPELLEGGRGKQLQRRLKRIKRWLIIRGLVIAFLFAGAIATVLGFVLRALPALSDLEAGLDLYVRISTYFSAAFALGYLLSTRTLAQLEIDAIMLFHLEHHNKA